MGRRFWLADGDEAEKRGVGGFFFHGKLWDLGWSRTRALGLGFQDGPWFGRG